MNPAGKAGISPHDFRCPAERVTTIRDCHNNTAGCDVTQHALGPLKCRMVKVIIVGWLLKIPAASYVYLRDGSALTTVLAKLQTRLTVSPI